MVITTEREIIDLIQEDKWMMELLKCAQTLNLPDWWICAGFVRSKIWDVLHGFDERTRIPDIDVIYYDRTNIEKSVEKEYEEALERLLLLSLGQSRIRQECIVSIIFLPILRLLMRSQGFLKQQQL